MIRTRWTVALLFASAVVAACRQDTRTTPTEPTVALRAGAAAPLASCSSKSLKQLQSEISALFGSALQTTANNKVSVINSLCTTNNAAARDSAITYMIWTDSQYPAGILQPKSNSGFQTKAQALTSHWMDVSAFVGFTPPFTVPTQALDASGAVGVMDGAVGGYLITGDGQGAIYLYPNAATGLHLFTIALNSPGCLSTNLLQRGQCYQIDIWPGQVLDTNTKGMLVGICNAAVPDADDFVGRFEPNGDATTRVLPQSSEAQAIWLAQPAVTPPNQPFCGGANDVGLVLPRREPGLFGAGKWALASAGAALTHFFVPDNLYATHTVATGGTFKNSLFNQVKTTVFFADFNNSTNVIGQPPGAPEVGTWTQASPPPGSILVQQSLGDLLNQPVVLNQGGGACTKCGTLLLQGNLTAFTGKTADVGTYEIRWQSLEAKPSVKGAPFVLRGSNGGRLATLTYKSEQNQANNLYYNGVVVASWVQNVNQSFLITADLAAKTTSLSINGVPVTGAQNVPFQDSKTTDFITVAAEFSGIDAGIVGWDNISVARLADSGQ
jgi:hypothetical protein